MPVFQLSDKIIFPDPNLAEPDGLLAIGGDLSQERLLLAYSNGIFPWFSDGYPILWWSPNPRMVLIPKEFKRHKNLRRLVNKKYFSVTFNKNFEGVINSCAGVSRENQDGTWITDNMKQAYIALHHSGYAHSVEVWENDNLVGGLYGVLMGKVFFGESMFYKVSNASKVALWYLVDRLLDVGVELIDVQQETEHLKSLGARLIDRESFLNLLVQLI